MNHQFGPRKPSFPRIFLVPRNSGSKPWWNHTANVVHAHRSNFNARPPRCDRVRKSGGISWEEEGVKNAATAIWQTEKIHHVYCSPVGVKATGAQ